MDYIFNQEFTIEFEIKKVLNDPNSNFLCVSGKNIKYNVKINNSNNIQIYNGYKPRDILIRGYFISAYQGDKIQAIGRFTTFRDNNDNSNPIIELTSLPTVVQPKSIDAAIKDIPHVNKATMQKVVAYLDANSNKKTKISDVISEVNINPEFLDKIQINQVAKVNIINWCNSHRDMEAISITLMSYGISPDVACKIYKIYGSNSLYFLSKDPYEAYRFGCLEFNEIDRLVEGKIKNVKASPKRLSALILSAINTAYQNGDMCISFTKLIKNTQDNNVRLNGLKENYIFSETEIKKHLEVMIKDYKIVIKTIKTSNGNIDYYYSTENYEIENSLAEKIANLNGKTSDFKPFEKEIRKALEDSTLSKTQINAVTMALTNKICIITGGAGTGKTWTINAIIKILKTLCPSLINRPLTYSLLAPTGKAAARIREVSNEPAVTIHSRLGLMNGAIESFAVSKKEDNIIHDDFIIVDEASMIDEKLFSYLMNHISENTCVILSGDSNQLPSVEAGNVLNEMIQYKLCEHIELDKVYRQSETSDIINNSFLIKDATNESINKINFKNGRDFIWIEEENEEKIKNLILAKYDNLLANSVQPEDIMLLSPVHNGQTGTNELNQIIEEKVNNSLISSTFGEKRFRTNDRIILTMNLKVKVNKIQYRICNGDLGYIDSFEYNEKTGKTTTLIRFDAYDILIPIREANMQYIELAYAITVHKSQGSETKYIIMSFVNNYLTRNLLTNRLIYTAVTRAKVKFIGIGSSNLFKEICLKKDYIKRQTNLGYFVQNLISDKTIYKK